MTHCHLNPARDLEKYFIFDKAVEIASQALFLIRL